MLVHFTVCRPADSTGISCVVGVCPNDKRFIARIRVSGKLVWVEYNDYRPVATIDDDKWSDIDFWDRYMERAIKNYRDRQNEPKITAKFNFNSPIAEVECLGKRA